MLLCGRLRFLHDSLVFLVLIIALVAEDIDYVRYLETCDDLSGSEESLADTRHIIYPVLIGNVSTQSLDTPDPQSKTRPTNLMMGFRYQSTDYLIKLQLNRGIRSLKADREDSVLKNSWPRSDFKSSDGCYYQGVFSVPDNFKDFVAVSTCNGISGLLIINQESYRIEPVNYGQIIIERCRPHVLSKLQPISTGSCDSHSGHWRKFSQLHSTEYYKQLSSSGSNKVKRNLESKYVELGLVVDNALSELFSHNTSRIRDYLLEVTNLIDLYYQRLNVRVSLTYTDIWTSGDRIRITSFVKENIQNFLTYTKSLSSRRKYDVIHLLSGKSFDGSSMGLAIPDSVCANRAIAVISVKTLTSHSGKLASNIAHMIGHNIGLEHDTPDCSCEGLPDNCIMNDFAGDNSPYLFSSCSIDRLRLLTRVGLGQCLSDLPDTKHYPQICGNGIIERGEQCDCGPPSSCQDIDSCCNASTCLLKLWATCRSGECCESCRPKTMYSLCRPAKNNCDAPEYCDGLHGECPTDRSIQDGQPCDYGKGFCYQGRCPSRSNQCERLWGTGSITSSDSCYSMYNPGGNVLGHCGQNKHGYYKKCTDMDKFCGLLQCDGGGDLPIIEDVDYRKTSTNQQAASQGEITCKTVNSKQGMDQVDKGMVLDGTKCGESHLCQGHRCLHVDDLLPLGCPVSTVTNTTCSGNGRCTSDMRCACSSGYIGDVCEIEIPVVNVTVPFSIPLVTQEPRQNGIQNGVLTGVILSVTILSAVSAAIVCMYRNKAACFKKNRNDIKQKKSNSNGIGGSSTQSVNKTEYYTTPLYYQNSGRKRRRRRRFYRSSSSSGETSEDENETTPPCVIYDVPLTDQPSKGILKKPVFEESNSDSDNSQCSCDGSSSCSGAEGEYSIPLPQVTSLCVETHHNLSQNTSGASQRETDRQARHSVSANESYRIQESHDSASDSAIDLPKGDSSISTLSDSSAVNKLSPRCNNQGFNWRHAAPLQTILDCNASSCNTLTEQLEDGGNHYENTSSPTDSKSMHVDRTTPTSGLHRSNHESLDETDALLGGDDGADPNFSTYSIRPLNGPMRTFQPIGKPTCDISKALISDTT